MELDTRKMMILKAVIRKYLETGEPVGSRTISKIDGLSVSSATIRNEMADLEEMGLLVQPHTSAGRIPSDAGYRLYVDELMEEKDREVQEIKDFMNSRMVRVESMLKSLAKMLAANTNYATMISGPRYSENTLKLIQLSRVDAHNIVAVIILEGNTIRNKMIPVDSVVSDEELLKLNVLLNSSLQGKSMDEITLALIKRLKDEAGDYSGIVGNVLEAVADSISESIDEHPEVYTSGATNIFKYPELSESSTASEILTSFEEKNEFMDAIAENRDQEKGIQVYIGRESRISSMKDCSVVTANYELGPGLHGTIGIIGPKRMDYDRVFGTLKTLMQQLDQIYHNEDQE